MFNKQYSVLKVNTCGLYVDKGGKSNTPDTLHAIFEYDELNCVWQHRSWGTAPDPDYPWALMMYGDKGTLKCSPYSYDFIPDGSGEKIHRDCVYEREKYPEDLKEPDIELNAAPAMRAHMVNFLQAIDNNTLPIADIEQGHISTASCIMANMSMKLGRPLSYDPIHHIISGDAEATKLLARNYRAPWVQPGVGLV